MEETDKGLEKEKKLQRVKKHLTIMLILKSLGSMLAQVGLWHAGEGKIVLILIMPAVVFGVGYLLIKNAVTIERAEKLNKMIPLLYAFLTLAILGNFISFLIKMEFI